MANVAASVSFRSVSQANCQILEQQQNNAGNATEMANDAGDMEISGGFIKGILRGVRCTKSLRASTLFTSTAPVLDLCCTGTQKQYSSLMNPPQEDGDNEGDKDGGDRDIVDE